VKICCIQGVEEARLAVRYGASALGVVSAMPSGPGVIPEETIAEVAAAVPPSVSCFLLTSRQDAAGIIEQQRRLRVDTLQLCDRLDSGCYDDLREGLPGIRIVQVVHVTGLESVAEAKAAAAKVDAILLDSGNPALKVKELGGTGRRHDWTVSRRIREEVGVPVFLAGGLTADVVPHAIQEVGPFALDVCTGVRSGGVLDEGKLAAFMAAAQGE